MADMNRRAFLASLTAVFALDPERALWTPGNKLISIPKPPRPELVQSFAQFIVPAEALLHPSGLDAWRFVRNGVHFRRVTCYDFATRSYITRIDMLVQPA